MMFKLYQQFEHHCKHKYSISSIQRTPNNTGNLQCFVKIKTHDIKNQCKLNIDIFNLQLLNNLPLVDLFHYFNNEINNVT